MNECRCLGCNAILIEWGDYCDDCLALTSDIDEIESNLDTDPEKIKTIRPIINRRNTKYGRDRYICGTKLLDDSLLVDKTGGV